MSDITKTQSEHWAKQKPKESYWTNVPAVRRSKWFAEQLKDYEFDTILEVGCSAGRNLKYILERFGDVSVFGIDVNAKAIESAKANIPKERSVFKVNDLYNINNFDRDYDIIFSSGVLIHVPPANLKSIIDVLVLGAPKYIMHIEHLGNNEVVTGPKNLNPTYAVKEQMQWAPDLIGIYRDLGYEPIVMPLPDDCKTNGAAELIVIDIKKSGGALG
jgi:SAM-dependent methyltransferase